MGKSSILRIADNGLRIAQECFAKPLPRAAPRSPHAAPPHASAPGIDLDSFPSVIS